MQGGDILRNDTYMDVLSAEVVHVITKLPESGDLCGNIT